MRVRIFKILKMINRAVRSQCFTDYKSKEVKKQHVTLRQELEKAPRYRTEDICICSVGKGHRNFQSQRCFAQIFTFFA
jgi:hypothetical protein